MPSGDLGLCQTLHRAEPQALPICRRCVFCPGPPQSGGPGHWAFLKILFRKHRGEFLPFSFSFSWNCRPQKGVHPSPASHKVAGGRVHFDCCPLVTESFSWVPDVGADPSTPQGPDWQDLEDLIHPGSDRNPPYPHPCFSLR